MKADRLIVTGTVAATALAGVVAFLNPALSRAEQSDRQAAARVRALEWLETGEAVFSPTAPQQKPQKTPKDPHHKGASHMHNQKTTWVRPDQHTAGTIYHYPPTHSHSPNSFSHKLPSLIHLPGTHQEFFVTKESLDPKRCGGLKK